LDSCSGCLATTLAAFAVLALTAVVLVGLL
jgi:hypothetical protein